jgi:hypothetical protein
MQWSCEELIPVQGVCKIRSSKLILMGNKPEGLIGDQTKQNIDWAITRSTENTEKREIWEGGRESVFTSS